MLLIPPQVTLSLTGTMFVEILESLRKRPYEVAQPIMAELEAQLAKQQPADAAAPPPTPPGEKNVTNPKSNGRGKGAQG